MGIFHSIFNKKLVSNSFCSDSSIVAIADGELIDITTVPDPMFAQKMMGDGVAFQYHQDKLKICSPANGKLTVLFPTGHAFGIMTKEGIEILVHIGIDTVNSKGAGFRILTKLQGDTVKAGDPIVEVDYKLLRKKYDMSTMLIITNSNGHKLQFIEPKTVKRLESIIL